MVKEGLAFFFTKSPEMPMWNDKNCLSWIENIGEVALYVKGEASTRYAVLGLGYGRRSCACPLVPRSGRRAQARRAGGVSRAGRDIFTAMNLLGVVPFLAKSE
jgi:hypothetical protein